jgi:hypothetical protein
MSIPAPNPLPAANRRSPLCSRRLPQIRCSVASSGLGFPAAAAEGGRSAVHLGAVVRVGQVLPLGSMFPD